MPAKAVNLIVARSHVQGDIQISLEAPSQIKAAVGQRIVVKFPVKLVEASRGQETFRFTLKASLDGQQPEPVEEVFRDRPGIPDEEWVSLEQVLTARRAGAFNLRYEVAVEYTVGAWGSQSAEQVMSETRSGDILVDVA